MSRSATVRDEYWEEEALVDQYATLVKRIARHLMARLPACVQADDLEQVGFVGLMEAVRLYDPSRGASFETYATIRVRGAMIDELRRNDWSPRSLSRRARQISEASRAIEHRKSRAATPREIADSLNLSLDKYHQWVLEVSNQNFSSLDNLEGAAKSCDDDMDSTYVSVEKVRCRNYLSRAIRYLSEREQVVLSLYYEKEMTLREIGEIMGISEPRVCQIRAEVVLRLRRQMENWQ